MLQRVRERRRKLSRLLRIASPAMLLVGLVIVSERWLLLLPIALLVPMQVVRARKEERVLAAAFGEEYERYKAGTWF